MPNEPNLWEQFMGKRTRDIDLPSEGKLDPRLNKNADPAAKVKALAGNSALQALKDYGMSTQKKAK